MMDKHLPPSPRTPARTVLTPLMRWTLTLLVAVLVLSAVPLPAPSGSDSGVTYTHSVEAKKKKKKKKNKKKHKGGKTTPTPTPIITPTPTPIVTPTPTPTTTPTPTPTPIPEGACEFTKTQTTWTLQSSCITSEIITVPGGITLDGANHTIVAKGPIDNFFEAVLLVEYTTAPTHIRNVKLDGSGLSGRCNDAYALFASILYYRASGSITDVDIANFRFDRGDNCGHGIVIDSYDQRDTVKITESHITHADEGIIVFEARVESSGNIITDSATGIRAVASDNVESTGDFIEVNGTAIASENSAVQVLEATLRGSMGLDAYGQWADASIEESDIAVGLAGVAVSNDGAATVSGNTILTGRHGVWVDSDASAQVTTNTITGTRRIDYSYGAFFADSTKGTLKNNQISTFNCGIGFNPHQGLTVENNIFASNTQNECPPIP